MNQKRQHTRLDFEAAIELVVGDDTIPGRTVNVSQGGIFVMSEPTPAFGEKLVLKIDLPGVPKKCEIPCIVRWSKPGAGAGLQFEQLRAIEAWALNKLVATLQ